ncbi:MAG TPA: gliding motility-associated C-terminal domain-containing protein [Puia sp.]|nr:gliding motility-associated C-terminal domain-containing protein [Puia sp.]
MKKETISLLSQMIRKIKNISALRIQTIFLVISFIFCSNISAQIITTIAGGSNYGYSGDGGPAINAAFSNPISVALDAFGNMYVSDYFNHRVRKIDKVTGIVKTIAGTGIPGFSGDGGLAVNAQINSPGDLCADATGNIYFIDNQNFRVRKIDASGIITTIVGNGNTNYAGETIPAINAGIDYPNGIAVSEKYLYLSLFSLHRICAINLSTDIITGIGGIGVNGFSGDGGAAVNAAFGYPAGLSVTANGEVYVADFANNRIRKIDVNGIVTTVVGNGAAVYAGDGGLPLSASLNSPTGVFVDAIGNIFIADRSNQVIRKVEASTGIISTVAGSGNYGYGGDGGLATSPCVKFADPHNVREDADGNLFISDQSNNCIRKVDTSHRITLIPSITISTISTNICSGASVTFNAAVSNAGINPFFQWKINGLNVGKDSLSFTTSSLNNDDIITCDMTANIGCNSSSVISNSITVTVSQGIEPTISVHASADSICPGDNIIFTATASNAGTSPSFQWKINGADIGSDNSVYSGNNFVNKDQVACVLTADDVACQSLVSSNIVVINVRDSSVISISPYDTSVITGSQVQLRVAVNGSVVSFHWMPSELLQNATAFSPTTKPLTSTNIFALTLTNTDGCTSHASAIIHVKKPLLMPSAFTPNNDGKNDVFRIPSGTLLTLIDFSIYDRWGSKVFSTKDISKGWDGRVAGKLLPAGSFVYSISGTSENKKVFFKGTVILIR